MRRIPLTQGKYTIVDDEDYEYLCQWKWYAYKQSNGDYYAARHDEENTKHLILMHRFVMKIDKHIFIDHRNGNGLDNQKKNLRIATNQQNQFNQKSRRGKSKYKGVFWNKQNKKWIAQTRFNYKVIYLGTYQNESDAAKAYNSFAQLNFGEFANLNQIESEVA